jgi:endonuclease G, mitochondrial
MTAKNDGPPTRSSEKEDKESQRSRDRDCCRDEFDARAAILALSRDVARLSEIVARVDSAAPPPSSMLRHMDRAPGLDDPRMAAADDARVRALVEAAPAERQDAVRRSARLLVGLGDIAARRRPMPRPSELIRIVGGDEAQPGSFQHCACVGDSEEWMCTGALVANQVVLTAAHCGPGITRAMVGGNDVFSLGAEARVVPVSKVAVHPGYRPHPYSENDISILILSDEVAIEPVSIATRAQVAAADAVRLVGFGYNDPQEPKGFGTKRHVEIDIPPIMRATVDDDLGELERLLDLHGEYEFACGRKALGRDSCNGDSGGPAYIRVGGDYCLGGLTSRATGEAEVNCGDGGIYVLPQSFRNWIDETVSESGAQAITWN